MCSADRTDEPWTNPYECLPPDRGGHASAWWVGLGAIASITLTGGVTAADPLPDPSAFSLDDPSAGTFTVDDSFRAPAFTAEATPDQFGGPGAFDLFDDLLADDGAGFMARARAGPLYVGDGSGRDGLETFARSMTTPGGIRHNLSTVVNGAIDQVLRDPLGAAVTLIRLTTGGR